MEATRDKQALFASLPPAWPDDLSPHLRAASSSRKLVVLDDDPTGTQTVRDVPVLTRWTLEILAEEFANPSSCFYILTNTRAYPKAKAEAISREIAQNLKSAAHGREFVVISRGDSTLRGHFPAETDALGEILSAEIDRPPILLIPFFEAGGRFTIDDVHYVQEGEQLIPAAETPFAKDAAFGYQNSNLRKWVEEMTTGAIAAEAVHSISLTDVRHGGPDVVAAKLLDLPTGAICIANAACQRDLEVIALASIRAEDAGIKLIYRTAAGFVAARLGQVPGTLWTPPPAPTTTGGLIIVGSHVPKTTAQLATALTDNSLVNLELPVSAILDSASRDALVSHVLESTEDALSAGRDVVISTSRVLMAGTSADESLTIASMVSATLVEIVKRLSVRPRYLIAKGGITSSDLATAALGVTRAMVLGQILPGVPVWEIGPETRFPGIPYIIFPGNVGGPEALRQAINILKSPL